VRSRGVGRTIKGVDGGTASWRRSSGNEVDGDDGRRVRIGVGEAVVSDNGNKEERPRGMSRRISSWEAYRGIHDTSLIDPRPHPGPRNNILDRLERTGRPNTQLTISFDHICGDE
jgi:hypothetical protein